MVPSIKTIKRLCTLSNNRCAFAGCTTPLVEEETQSTTGDICHIQAKNKGGPRYNPSQTEEEREDFSNLILLCKRHHKIVDDTPALYTVENLQKMKAAHTMSGNVEVMPIDAIRADLLLKSYIIQVQGNVTVGSIHAESVTFKGSKRVRPKLTPPPNVVAGSASHRRYMAHLIKRYQEFASKQPGREFKFPAIHAAIKKEFGTTWEWVPLNRFESFAAFIQSKIDGTILGKLNRRKGTKSYSLFEEYDNRTAGPLS
jgi:hypothetical protein